MKVVLAAIHPVPSPQAVPLANAFLKAYLGTDEELAARVAVTLCDFLRSTPADVCAAEILAHEPDAVGFSLYLWNTEESGRIAAELRRNRPGITIFAGGPQATADPLGTLTGGGYDFLILGEGEVPFLEVTARLADGRPFRGAPGTAWLDDGKLASRPQKPVALLDTIPSPFLSGIIEPGRYGGLLWQLSRGCDFACEYCFDYKGTKGVRRFSLERVDAELDFLVRHNVPQVFVLDSTFNVDAKRAKTILRMIRKRAPHIHFHFEVRSEFLDREMARLFAGITCSLQIGLQSADPAILKGIRRHFDPDDFRKRVALLNESGAVFGFDLIYGLPGDSLAGFRQSLDFALALYPNHLDIFPLAVLPGTPLAARAAQAGLDHLPAPPYALTATPTFPAPDMKRAARLAGACDIFYSRGKAVAWFNGVIAPLSLTPAEFLDAFGGWLARQGIEAREEALGDEAIWSLQRSFLAHIFADRRVRRLLPVALDLVDYHYHYAAALLAPPPELPTDRSLAGLNILDQVVCLAPSTRLARFSYEITDLLEAGNADLREICACFSPSPSWAVIYPRGNDIFTESLLESYFLLLEGLDGCCRAGDVVARLALSGEGAAEFLKFAAAEGIVTVRNCP
ncbi:Radical SAM domain protein [Geobacter metallireducens RCH3]|uniref:Radical SAM domain iron-sulfur cluster-binding oxidoreductase with cobalamin-binding-like domain n=1 Tax=Geobacter metallireducens (strain ATCC 53774 / DSM 7210 / GS-15) TaxID=269799 RepID=Q39ZH4_GEOMG|nr:B12-binding domain-containing radical SAM protein [Geobacter metallireducens]ABB30350.1 radical SAM domain iron-sulfur cluster-binding oxidoreductase with cobalamin-binding-like domain [Geobacter metallireducens GS-15]EHP85015.1 Radical SAM domain protein [Geobacter metallireducens RCH3]MBT1073695.1 B12-binding domain-containing radical SAM protein [Geobacter grbiciae]